MLKPDKLTVLSPDHGLKLLFQMKVKLAIGSAVLLVVAFIINTIFPSSVLSDGYQASEIKRFLIPMESASAIIEKSIGNNDKRLSVSDIEEILDRQRRALNSYWENLRKSELDSNFLPAGGLVNLSVILKSGSSLVSTVSDTTEIDTSPALVDQISGIADGESSHGLEFVEDEKYFYVPHLLFDDQGRWIVSLIYQFQKDALRYTVASKLDQHIVPTIIVGLFSVVGVLFLYFQLTFKNRITRKKDFIADFVFIMLVSLFYSLLTNAVIFERQIIEASVKNARETISEMSSRLNDRLSLKASGVSFENQRFSFSDSFARFDDFDSITLANSGGEPVYRRQDEQGQSSKVESAVQTVVSGRLSENRFQVTARLPGADLVNGFLGTAVIHISADGIYKSWASMIFKGITIIFVTILIIVECLLLYLHLLNRRGINSQSKSRYQLGFIRPAIFLFLFAIDLSMSFVPLHMQSYDAELFGLSGDIVLGLPISSEFLCVGIFILIAGVWIDRRGWHEPYFVGLLVVGIGSLSSWMAGDALMFILSRALVGVGYGLSLMSAQGLVVRFGGASSRARGFASLFAGLYSGSICGAAAGSFLAEWFGYEKVFFIGAIVVLVLIIFSYYFLRSLIDRSEHKPELEEKPRQNIALKSLLRFIGNPVFIALSVLSSLPASIAVAGFLHFFTPVYLDQIGARESTIGQVLILYGICLIYFGPTIGRFIDRSHNKKYFMLTGGLLGGLAFATFDMDFGLTSVIFSIFLLGLSSSLVLSSQSTMVLELKESQILGEGTALGIFRSISRIGQVIGPVIFGGILISGDLTGVINYLGLCYLGATLVLAVFVKNHTGSMANQKLAFQK